MCGGGLSGGDGAPGWTYEAVGFNPEHFTETGAAVVHAIHGEPLPRMIWPSNYSKLAAATMFTVFFGGNDFAPLLKIEGEPAQEYLQRHFIDALKQVAQRVKDLPNVVGFDSFNEPSTGYIGVKDLTRHINILSTDVAPTPFESMLLGAGLPRKIAVYQMSLIGPRKRGQRLINPQGVSAWQDDVVVRLETARRVGCGGQRHSRVCSSPITSLNSTAARSIRLRITSARSFAAMRAKSDR